MAFNASSYQRFTKRLETLSEKQREGVEAVAMDMWVAFENAVTEMFPNADITNAAYECIYCYDLGISTSK